MSQPRAVFRSLPCIWPAPKASGFNSQYHQSLISTSSKIRQKTQKHQNKIGGNGSVKVLIKLTLSFLEGVGGGTSHSALMISIIGKYGDLKNSLIDRSQGGKSGRIQVKVMKIKN